MTDSTHECPSPGCTKRVPFERFACPAHWFAMPAELRGRLGFEWRRHFGEDRYFAVRAECLAALGVPDDAIADENGGVGLNDDAPAAA